MSDGMGRELAYLSSHATNRYFIPNWGSTLSPSVNVCLDEPKYSDTLDASSTFTVMLKALAFNDAMITNKMIRTK